MDKGAFLEAQDRIYNRFRAMRGAALEDGLLPDPAVTEGRGGVVVCFRYDWSRITPLQGLSNRIGAFLPPTVTYGSHNAHTSIAVVGEMPHKIPDREEARQLVLTVRQNLLKCPAATRQASAIEFGDYLMNQTTIIAPGTPNDACLEVREAVLESLRMDGIQFKEAWGTYVTAARFGAEHSSTIAQEVSSILGRTRPIGTLACKRVEIATYTCRSGPDGFFYEAMAQYDLQNL